MKKLFYINFLLFVVAAMVISCKDDDEKMILIPNLAAAYPEPNTIHFGPDGGIDTIRDYGDHLRRLIEYQGIASYSFYTTIKKYNQENLTMPGKAYRISDTIVGDWFKLIKLPPKNAGFYHVEVQPNLSDSTRLLVLWTDNYEKVAWWYQSDTFHGWECEPYFFIEQQACNSEPEN